MKRLVAAFWIIGVMGMLVFSGGEHLLGQTSSYAYRYTYATQAQDAVVIMSIDPTDPENTEAIVAAETQFKLLSALGHPQSEWVVLRYSDVTSTSAHVDVFNIRTQETRNILMNAPLQQTPMFSFEDRGEFYWSPDGKYLAFVLDSGSYDLDVYVYSFETDTMFNLMSESGELGQYRVAWSNDSSQLAVHALVCPAATCNVDSVRITLQIFDIISKKVTSSLDITELTHGAGYESAICQFRWSPDDSYISLMAGCDGSSLGNPRETYLINIAQETITQLTHYTDIGLLPNLIVPSLFASYESIWLDTNHLLISAIWRDHGDIQQQRGVYSDANAPLMMDTLIYDVVSGQAVPMFDKWVVYPTNRPLGNELAFLEMQPGDDHMEATSIKIASWTTQSLTPFQDLPIGCNIAWSPDGRFLAYSIREGTTPNCDTNYQIDGFGFFDMSTQTAERVDTKGIETFPIGWISVESIS